MNIGDRFKNIRKHYALSQEHFGNRLGITGAAVSRIENEQRTLTSQIAKLVCKEFQVNEDWLLNGVGQMLDEHIESKKNINEAIKILDSLTPELQNYAIQQMKGLLEIQKSIKNKPE